jgi:hypothetical protein
MIRLGAMTSDVGPMIQQWTTGSALSHLRSFVAGIQVELDQLLRYVVEADRAPACARARASRLAAQQRGGAAAPDTVAASREEQVAEERTAAATTESGEGEETFLTPRAGSPDSPALMEVDHQFEARYIA